ncbi:FHF complex subunit HOOK-interacting protein 1B [Amia ocellicauda]|uniref:FHF complex subunit HOOK-interacting protein 1B n=1 Tax=Amia ocellicauda TaxID=2972642 RepID=UPI003463A6F8
MSWLSRLNPRAPGNRASRNAAPSNPVMADPETCLMVFQNHWRQMSWILEQRESSITGAADELSAVRNHTDQMLCLLAEERPGDQMAMGPILELVVSENILERLVQWHLRRGLDPDSQGALLKLFEMLIGQSQQPLLQHKPVLQPLLSLLSTCADPQLGSPAVEGSLVLLLNQVCVSMAREPSILELLFRAASQQGPTNLLIFSLLVPFIHRDGAIGQQARDALLLVMATSADSQAVAQYIAENSYFCPVLATGLSALYSSLPRKIEVRGDDWHALRREDWIGVASLVLFMNSLEFCNAVIQVSHPLVKSQLVDYVHNGFLVPVMGPALHKSSVEEMIASTAYLDLFLRSISETALLKTFLRFILLHRHDNDTILDTLLTRINTNSRLCMVSLSLFRTLLSLNCEDLMLQLVLRYLLPCTHVMLSQRRAVRETDLYGKSADKFLTLIPECCLSDTGLSVDRDEDLAFWPKGPGSPSAESPISKPSTPSRIAMFIRQQSSGVSSSSEPPQSPRHTATSGTLSPDSPMHQAAESPDSEMGYLEYLRDARRNIELCAWACRDWSAPYDGEDPSPSSVVPPPHPAGGLTVFSEHFSSQGAPVRSRPDWETPELNPSQQKCPKPDFENIERDSGEWDITINKNCISVTPRTKKRSLQREFPDPLHSSHHPGLPLLTAHPHLPAGTEGQLSLFNGMGQAGSESGPGSRYRQDGGMEVKKVRRDPEGENCGEQNGGQSIACKPEPSRLFHSLGEQGHGEGQGLTQLSQAHGQTASQTSEGQDSGPGQPTVTPRNLESVESLIEELLDRDPSDANGTGISIEAFNQELRELEETVCERRAYRGAEPPSSAKDGIPPAPTHRKEEERPPSPDCDLTNPKPESTGPLLCSPARPLGQPLSQPYTGPFIAVIFAKLENMLQNSLYVNILLTGIVAQLACYPQPLLRSFLLNTNMVFQPSVKSLIQVLGSVKNRIEAFAATQEDFPGMLRKARKYLVARGKLDWADSPIVVPNLRRTETLVKSRKPSLGDLILRHTNSPTRARQAAQMAFAHVRDGGQVLHSALFRSSGAGTIERQNEALRVKNAVYCAVVFTEFLKELAALAQEHAVSLPFPRSQDTEE